MTESQAEDAGNTGADDTGADDTGAEQPRAGDGGASAVGRDRRWLRWAALAAAVAVMGSGLVAWWRTDHDDTLALADTRDEVLIAARQHIETMNTLDYRKVEEGLDAWRAVTTGTLHDQLVQVSKQDRKLLAQQQKVASGDVVDAAVFDLDDDSATVIAAVEITVRDGKHPDAEPSVKRNRFSATLVRVGASWKLEELQQVAVNLS